MRPRIWHWHGYKPADVQCWMRAMAMGLWPWRPPACKKKAGARCVYRPMRAAGCRLYGSIQPTACWLRTYTYLLRQHERLLQWATSNATA